MVITINGSEVEYSAPGVSTLGEVTGAVKQWLAQQGWSWRSATLDGKEYNQELEPTPIGQASVLAISADHVASQLLEHLELLHDFVDLTARGCETKPEPLLAQIREVWEELEPVLPSVFGLALGPREKAVLESLKTAMTQGWEGLAALSDDLDHLQGRLSQMQTLIRFPNDSLAHLKERLAAHLPKAADIPMLYQSGKERDASAALLETLDIIDLVFLWYQVAAPGGSVPSEAVEAASFLHELEEALLKSDWILSGDLLEYEILPRLTKIANSDTISTSSDNHETTGT